MKRDFYLPWVVLTVLVMVKSPPMAKMNLRNQKLQKKYLRERIRVFQHTGKVLILDN